MNQTLESIPEQFLEEGIFAGQTTYNDFGVDLFGNLVLTTDLEAFLIVIRSVVQTNLGELQYNVNGGVPHLQTIFSDITTIELWKSSMYDAIEAINGVNGVEFIEIDYDSANSVLKYTASINTIYGNGEINGGTLQI